MNSKRNSIQRDLSISSEYTFYMLYLRLFLLEFIFLFIGWVTDTTDYGISTRFLFQVGMFPLLGRFVLYLCAVHIALIWPVTQFASKEVSQIRSCSVRRLVLSLFPIVPLIAFGYYLGNFKSLFDLFELFLVVVPPVLIGVILFEETESAFVWSSFVALSTFTSFFLIGDLLGPYDTLLRYAPHRSEMLTYRAMGPLLALLTASFSTKHAKRALFEEGYALMLIGIASFALVFVLKQIDQSLPTPIKDAPMFCYWSVFFFGTFALIRMRGPMGYKGSLILIWASVIGLFSESVYRLIWHKPTAYELIWLMTSVSGMVANLSLYLKLQSKRYQVFFQTRVDAIRNAASGSINN